MECQRRKRMLLTRTTNITTLRLLLRATAIVIIVLILVVNRRSNTTTNALSSIPFRGGENGGRGRGSSGWRQQQQPNSLPPPISRGVDSDTLRSSAAKSTREQQQQRRQRQQQDNDIRRRGSKSMVVTTTTSTTTRTNTVSPLQDEIVELLRKDGYIDSRRKMESRICQFELGVIDLLLQAGSNDAQMILNAAKAVHTQAKRNHVSKRRRKQSLKFALSKSSLSSSEEEEVDTNLRLLERVEGVLQELKRFGMTGNDIATIFCHTPALALRRTSSSEYSAKSKSESVEETLARVMDTILSNTLRLRRYDARKIIRSCPGLLTIKGSMAAQHTLEIFCNGLNVSANSIARQKSSLPTLLSRPPSYVFRLVSYLSSTQVNIPLERIGPLLRRPEGVQLLNILAPPMNTLIRVEETEQLIPEKEEQMDTSCTTFYDKIEHYYRQMNENIQILKEDIELDDEVIGNVVATNPTLLLQSNAKEQLMSIQQVLCGSEDKCLDLDDYTFKSIINSYPQLLSANATSLEESIEFLYSMDISKESLQKIVRAFPSIICLNVQNDMIPVVEFLKDIGVINIGRFITRLPPVLGYSVQKELRPKWNFLTRVGQMGYYELVRFPGYFSYPLDRIIEPRYTYLTLKGIPPNLPPLDEVLRYGDSDFARLVVGDRDGYCYTKFLRERKLKQKQGNKKEQQQQQPIKNNNNNSQKRQTVTTTRQNSQ